MRLLLLGLVRGMGLVSGGYVDRSQYAKFCGSVGGGGGKDQLESLTMCVDMSNDIL